MSTNGDDQDVVELMKLHQGMESMARNLLAAASGYPPFGGTLDRDGEVSILFDEASMTRPSTPESLTRMQSNVRESAASTSALAAAVAQMAYVIDDRGARNLAIVVSLQHRTGRSIDIAVPCSRAANGAVTVAAPQVGVGNTKFF